MERRNFLKTSCNFCLLGAAGMLLPNLVGCGPAKYAVYKAPVNNNTIEVPISLFAQSPIQFVRPGNSYYDIAVQKKDDGSYAAILLQCTHQENQLTPTANGYQCSLHGSVFDKDGIVRKGPAEHSLEKYKTTVQQDKLIIYIKA